jgi:hypothetical protein
VADSVDSLVLEHLRHLRAAAGRQAEKADLLIGRVDNLELGLARVERQLAKHSMQFAEHSVRMGRIDRRLERIERRLDLVEA